MYGVIHPIASLRINNDGDTETRRLKDTSDYQYQSAADAQKKKRLPPVPSDIEFLPALGLSFSGASTGLVQPERPSRAPPGPAVTGAGKDAAAAGIYEVPVDPNPPRLPTRVVTNNIVALSRASPTDSRPKVSPR